MFSSVSTSTSVAGSLAAERIALLKARSATDTADIADMETAADVEDEQVPLGVVDEEEMSDDLTQIDDEETPLAATEQTATHRTWYWWILAIIAVVAGKAGYDKKNKKNLFAEKGSDSRNK
jgi:hypothetical protein